MQECKSTDLTKPLECFQTPRERLSSLCNEIAPELQSICHFDLKTQSRAIRLRMLLDREPCLADRLLWTVCLIETVFERQSLKTGRGFIDRNRCAKPDNASFLGLSCMSNLHAARSRSSFGIGLLRLLRLKYGTGIASVFPLSAGVFA